MERKMKRKEESGRIEESGSGSSEGEKPRKKWVNFLFALFYFYLFYFWFAC